MSPDALRYYKKWLENRLNPLRLYVLVYSLILTAFLLLAIFLRLKLGDWTSTGGEAFVAAIMSVASALVIWAIRKAANIAGWTLLESLESGYRAGQYREVWHALMMKYRGFHPDIIAEERFHVLFVAVASDIVAREELTAEQKQWTGELLTVARANLSRAGGVSASPSKAKYMKPLLIAYLISSVLFAAVKIIEVLTSH